MNDRGLISVIIPVYNAEQYIDRCMESVLNQTYKNIEVLLIDDGSTDGSLDKCAIYSEQYSNILAFSKKNGGAADARNFGIERAKGEYIAFVDIDDFIHPQYFEILYSNCLKYDAQISICQFKIVHSDHIVEKIEKQEIKCRDNIEILYDCCALKKTAVVSPCCKLIKKDIFKTIRFPIGRTYEDLATAHKIMYAAEKIVISDSELYYYYMSDNSVTRKAYSLLNFNSENLAQDERLEFYKKLNNEDLYQVLLVSVERNRIANYCKAQKYLKQYKDEKNKLRKKFLNDYKFVQLKKCGVVDRVLFWMFRFMPAVCVYIMFPIYEYHGSKIWS